MPAYAAGESGHRGPPELGMILSGRGDLASGNWSRRALPLFALAATVTMASPALAQNSPLGQKPNAPFQEKGAGVRLPGR
jgi:hypothetical protein